MSGNFLTPTAIWKDFKIDGELKAEVIAKTSVKGVSVSHLRISGRKTADGEVGIYAVLKHKAQLTLAPAILLAEDFNSDADSNLAQILAEKGYVVLSVDVAGATEYNKSKKIEGVENPYTIYPESLSYANYDKNAEDKAEIAGDTRATCWYEWGRVIRYSVEYLKTRPLITKIGLIGLGRAATPMWQVLSASCGISCAVIVSNAGWKGYRGIEKFGDTSEPQFSDEALKYLAGIEPQAYAAHVKCPLLLLAPTNSHDYDIDRAYDTVSRVPASVYSAADYSVGGINEVNAECFDDALIFLQAFLISDSPDLPSDLPVKGNYADGVLQVEVSPDEKGLKNLAVYFSEEEISPALRAWERCTDAKPSGKGTYIYEYAPQIQSGAVFFFARAEYDSGLRICSCVLSKKYDGGGKQDTPVRVLYSSRQTEYSSGFFPVEKESGVAGGVTEICTDKKAAAKVNNGPMDIAGLFSPSGVTTFNVNIAKYKPLDGAILMFDIFVKGGGNFCVKAITDYFGERTEYAARIKPVGDLWQNVKIELNNFKTEQGLGLKSYEKVEALEFSSDEEFLINNILWV